MSSKIRILVAEDHLVARVGVSAIINRQTDMVVVAEATNGKQAVERFRKHVPDVTLLDMRMPLMSGVEAAIAIRGEFPNARLIALTSYGGDEDVRRALAAGVNAYLTKDVLQEGVARYHSDGERRTEIHSRGARGRIGGTERRPNVE